MPRRPRHWNTTIDGNRINVRSQKRRNYVQFKRDYVEEPYIFEFKVKAEVPVCSIKNWYLTYLTAVEVALCSGGPRHLWFVWISRWWKMNFIFFCPIYYKVFFFIIFIDCVMFYCVMLSRDYHGCNCGNVTWKMYWSVSKTANCVVEKKSVPQQWQKKKKKNEVIWSVIGLFEA